MATLRKRALSVDTTTVSSAAAAAAARESKQANPVVARAGDGETKAGDDHGDGAVVEAEEEPVSLTGRLFREPHFRCYIVCVIGLGAPVDLPAIRAGVAATLARHPRFCSVQMKRSLFEYIYERLAGHSEFFRQKLDAVGHVGFHGKHKCVVAMRMIAYGSIADSLDDGYAMAESTVLACVKEFASTVIGIIVGGARLHDLNFGLQLIYFHHVPL